jgi:hypothetical protein
MSSVNDSPNHFVVPDATSRVMKPVGKLARVTRLGKDLLVMMVKRPVSQPPRVIAGKKGFFGGKKERNND